MSERASERTSGAERGREVSSAEKANEGAVRANERAELSALRVHIIVIHWLNRKELSFLNPPPSLHVVFQRRDWATKWPFSGRETIPMTWIP